MVISPSERYPERCISCGEVGLSRHELRAEITVATDQILGKRMMISVHLHHLVGTRRLVECGATNVHVHRHYGHGAFSGRQVHHPVAVSIVAVRWGIRWGVYGHPLIFSQLDDMSTIWEEKKEKYIRIQTLSLPWKTSEKHDMIISSWKKPQHWLYWRSQGDLTS